MSTHVQSHEVKASRIVGVQPLTVGGAMVSPDAGLTLILDDDSKQRWTADKSTTPAVGDFLVIDTTLSITYVITAQKFASLFSETSKMS